MPIPLQPYIGAQRQQPGLSLNLDGIVRAPLHQLPSFSILGPSPNELSVPGGIPLPTCRIALLNLLALLKQPWYQQRSMAGLPGHDVFSYFEHQRCLQRECEVLRKAMMPGAAGLSYSSAFLEERHQVSVQRPQMCLQSECEVQRKVMMPGGAGLSYSSAFLEERHRDSVQRHGRWLQGVSEVQRKAMMPGAAGLSYSSAFLEQCNRESVQRSGWTR